MSVEAELSNLNRVSFQAEEEANPEPLERMLADDFKIVRSKLVVEDKPTMLKRPLKFMATVPLLPVSLRLKRKVVIWLGTFGTPKFLYGRRRHGSAWCGIYLDLALSCRRYAIL